MIYQQNVNTLQSYLGWVSESDTFLIIMESFGFSSPSFGSTAETEMAIIVPS